MIHNEVELEAANIFRKAAAYIRRYGWQQEGMGEHGAPRCSMGALDSAYPQIEWDKELASLMYTVLYDELGGISLTQFKSKYRSGEKVAHLFDRTAVRLQRGFAS
jgi:hypothetical protein